MPTTTLSEANFTDGKIAVLDLLVLGGLAPSKGEARRLIQQGGVLLGDDKVTDVYAAVERSAFEKDVILKKGKKSYQKYIVG